MKVNLLLKSPLVLLTLLVLKGNTLAAQIKDSLSLEQCQQMAAKNYPLLKNAELALQSGELRTKNLGHAFYPQVGIFAQASYQSAVTALPIELPGITVPSLSKDQYRAYAELSQAILDGGMTKQQKNLQQASTGSELHALQVELYKVKERVNQSFFAILLCQGQLRQVQLVNADLESALAKASSAVRNGVAIKSNEDVLKAEILRNQQRATELSSFKKTQLQFLSWLTGQEIPENTTLAIPAAADLGSGKRPELLLIEQQQKQVDAQWQLLEARNKPRLNLFLQAGIGRPALNMLSNQFEPYYIGGIRFSWNISGYYNLKNEKNLLKMNRSTLDVQREVFEFNNRFVQRQQENESQKYNALLQSDEEIIRLRNNIRKSAEAQLAEGTVTSSDYLRELHALDQAREAQLLHHLQLLAATYAARLAKGETDKK